MTFAHERGMVSGFFNEGSCKIMTFLRKKNTNIAGLAKVTVSAAVVVAALAWAPHSYAQAQQATQSSQQNFNGSQHGTVSAIDAPVQAISDQGGAQLPEGFAHQQLPPSFAVDDQQEQQGSSGQIIPAANQNSASKDGINQQPDGVPAQPAAQQLVPSTPMGASAQKLNNPRANNVEDSAEAAFQAQQAGASSSVLDEYSARAADAGQEFDGDALPQVDTSTMVKLQADFPNSAGKTSYGQIDGSMDAENNPVAKKALQDGIRRDAFDAAITGMFPLSPDQIKMLIGKYDETQRAVDAPPYAAPKPEISVTNISLDPGILPPTIKTAVGNVTTINILDATGAPWPVQDVTWAGDFEVVEPEQGGHIIRITPMEQFARGNIVIRLLTLKTPLTLTLATSRDVVQYRVDARVPEYGPFASAPLIQGGKSMVAGDSTLTSLLDGVAGTGMMKLKVDGADGRTTAYSSGGQTYVRTPLTLLSPAWKSSVSSADGMNVYVLSSAPVLLLSDEGEFIRATLSEKEDLLDE